MGWEYWKVTDTACLYLILKGHGGTVLAERVKAIASFDPATSVLLPGVRRDVMVIKGI